MHVLQGTHEVEHCVCEGGGRYVSLVYFSNLTNEKVIYSFMKDSRETKKFKHGKYKILGFEVLIEVVMKNSIFWYSSIYRVAR
jgi:hypothetical protein